MGVELDWGKLRKHYGSLHASFEQLCAVLAEQEGAPNNAKGWRFVRNGRPDGGVECFWEGPSGELHGFQAKYHRDTLASSQWKQLDVSLQHLLDKYPALTVVTVCLPIDLPHSPSGRGRTAREKWDAWQSKWRLRAQQKGRTLDIQLWGEHQISTFLIRNRAVARFFFDSMVLEANHLRSGINEQIKRAGARYQPQLHIEVEMHAIADWLSASPKLRRQIRDAAQSTRNRIADQALVDEVQGLSRWVGWATSLTSSLSAIETLTDSSDVRDYATHAQSVANALGRMQEAITPLKPGSRSAGSGGSPPETEISHHRWMRVSSLIEAIRDAAEPITQSVRRSWADALDKRAALLSGSGGCGKTHFLCDMATRLMANGQPAVLVFGNQLNVKTFWRDTYTRTGAFDDHREFLACLNVAGQVAGCRSLLLIDGLNEADGNSGWSTELRAILSAVAEYPYVSVLFTVRDSYHQIVWPHQSATDGLVQLVHPGFGNSTDDAVARYCDHYNIALPDIPLLRPEFENGLFLSMFCQAIAGAPDPNHQRPPVPFSGGVEGFSEVFDAFIARRELELLERFDLDRDLSKTPLATAMTALVDRLAQSPTLEIPVGECKQILERHLRSRKLDGNVVGLLESEGLLLRVPHLSTRGTVKGESVQIAFDRLAAHLVVKRWLSRYPTAAKATALFGVKGSLSQFTGGTLSHGRVASVCESLLQQWPERFGTELFDARPALMKDSLWCLWFLKALRSSAPRVFTDATAACLTACLNAPFDWHRLRADFVLDLLRRIGNPRLIDCLHEYLYSPTMAERDSWWTVGIGGRAAIDGADVLVTWAQKRSASTLPRELALSYVTSLAWLTTTTSVELRAQAIKAITAILEKNLHAAGVLLHRFRNVNDPYVLHSIGIAVYGACLRSTDSNAVQKVGEVVVSLWPSKRDWPCNLWTRHSLAGIVEVGKHRVSDWAVDLSAVQPPYQSDWVGRVESWEAIERDVKAREKLDFHQWAAVVSSCYPEGHYAGDANRMYGDFGRYIVSSACRRFYPLSASRAQPSVTLPFAYDMPHRFIIKRVRELGWTEERFERFDHSMDRGTRHQNTRERVGKKYQWVALGEFLARASDRFPLYSESWGDLATTADYQYPRQLTNAFHYDTSILRVRESVDGDVNTGRWWTRRDGEGFWDAEVGEEWLLSTSGIPDPSRFVIQACPGGGPSWAMLQGYLNWKENDPQHVSGRPTARKVFLHIHAMCIRATDLASVRRWMRSTSPNGGRPPEPRQLSDSMFGELYWSRSSRLEEEEPWQELESGSRGRPRAVLPLAAQYLNESDPTLGTSLYALVPSKWVVEAMCLTGGSEELTFCDRDGKVVCWNPSVSRGGDDAVFCDLGKLSAVAEEYGLKVVWCVFGEKNVVGDGWRHDGPHWPFVRGFYWLERGALAGGYDVVLDENFRAGRPRNVPSETRDARSRRNAGLSKILREHLARMEASIDELASPATGARDETKPRPKRTRSASRKK